MEFYVNVEFYDKIPDIHTFYDDNVGILNIYQNKRG
jgi:hypothetical protein